MRILAAMLEVPIGVSSVVHVGLIGCARLGARTLFPDHECHQPPIARRRYVPNPSLDGRYREIPRRVRILAGPSLM